MSQAYLETVWVMGKSNRLMSILASYSCCKKLPQIDGFKQYKGISLQLWRSEVENQSGGLLSLLEPLGKNLFSCPIHLRETATSLGSWRPITSTSAFLLSRL